MSLCADYRIEVIVVGLAIWTIRCLLAVSGRWVKAVSELLCILRAYYYRVLVSHQITVLGVFYNYKRLLGYA